MSFICVGVGRGVALPSSHRGLSRQVWAQVSGSNSRIARRCTTTSSAPSRNVLPTTATISHGLPGVPGSRGPAAPSALEVVLGRRDPPRQRMAARRRETPDGDHGRAGEGAAVDLLREREAAHELGRERPCDRRGRTVARLFPAQAEPVWRHDEHRRVARADCFEVVAHGHGVALRVLERLWLAARVALVREEDDLDRVPAHRGRVEHAGAGARPRGWEARHTT